MSEAFDVRQGRTIRVVGIGVIARAEHADTAAAKAVLLVDHICES